MIVNYNSVQAVLSFNYKCIVTPNYVMLHSELPVQLLFAQLSGPEFEFNVVELLYV